MVLKQFSWPYRLLMVVLLVSIYGFMRQPVVLLDDLKATLDSKDEAKWQGLTATAEAETLSKALMKGLLKIKYAADWSAGKEADAMNSYYGGLEQLNELSANLAGTTGFTHFICGDLSSFPVLPDKNLSDCWLLDGDLTWRSATQVQVAFVNPAQGWQSLLLLERDGLFAWHVSGVELPVKAMLAAYAKQLKAPLTQPSPAERAI